MYEAVAHAIGAESLGRAASCSCLSAAWSATFFVFAAIAMRVAVRALEVRVPELVGKPVEEARAVATDIGLVAARRRGPPPRSEESRPDTCSGQDPGAGRRRGGSAACAFWVSSGPRIVVAPKLVGESERAAQIRLTQEGRHAPRRSPRSATRLPARRRRRAGSAAATRAPRKCGCSSIAARIARATSCPT